MNVKRYSKIFFIELLKAVICEKLIESFLNRKKGNLDFKNHE